MSDKTRNISPYDFLQALQKEYISLEIRSKIYIHENDKKYFKTIMEKKENAITVISRREKFDNIVSNEVEYIRVWQEIVPKFGFPRLVYNVFNVSKKQLEFPYTGSAVEILETGEFGMSVKMDGSEVIVVSHDGSESRHAMDLVKRLDHKRTDEYFYYTPGNNFHCSDLRTGILKKYDMKSKNAMINFDKEVVTLQAENISRIL